MIDTGAYFPIRVYSASGDKPEYTDNRHECKDFEHQEYFWCPIDKLLTFQEVYIGKPGILPASRLVHIATNTVIPITLNSETQFVSPNTHVTNLGTDLEPYELCNNSLYYYERGGGVYSDPFYLGGVSNKVHMKYRGAVDTKTDNMLWREGFFAECYINSTIEKPEYPIFEETREDQEGDQHKVFQRWDKRHTLRFFGIESMADAMSLLPLMEHVEINGSRVFDLDVTIDWEDERDCLAEIIVSFSQRQSIKTF